VNPKSSLSLQRHSKRSEHWIIVKGIATIRLNEDEFSLHENQSTYIPIGSKHRLSNNESFPLRIIEVQCGQYLGEDDIVRFDDNYGRIN
jgi:mannose-6-phosphate isomerase-like protein (cupin superfamily)